MWLSGVLLVNLIPSLGEGSAWGKELGPSLVIFSGYTKSCINGSIKMLSF